MIAVQTILASLENHSLLSAGFAGDLGQHRARRVPGSRPPDCAAIRLHCGTAFGSSPYGPADCAAGVCRSAGHPARIGIARDHHARELAEPQYRANADSGTGRLRLPVAHDEQTLLRSADFGRPSSDRNHVDRVADSRQSVSPQPAVAAAKPILSAGKSPAIAPAASSNSLAAWPALLLWLWIAGAAIQATWLIWSAAGAWKLARSAAATRRRTVPANAR